MFLESKKQRMFNLLLLVKQILYCLWLAAYIFLPVDGFFVYGVFSPTVSVFNGVALVHAIFLDKTFFISANASTTAS